MKKLHTLILCFALLVLAACSDDNLFGSSSKNSNCGNDTKCLRIDAENAFREGDFKGSYEICNKIVSIDPTSSFGYFGMAKASLWDRGINPLSIFYLVRPQKDECPFMGDKVSTKERNDLFQAMKAVVRVLSELDRRDTLTALYERYKKGESLDSTLIAFKETFCGGNAQSCTDTTAKKESFPLTDKEYGSSYFRSILFVSTFSKGILNLFDTQSDDNTDNCLTRRGEAGKDYPRANEWEAWGCTKPGLYDLSISLKCPVDSTGKMNVIIDSEKILSELDTALNDYYKCVQEGATCDVPDGVKDINKTIDNFDGDFKDVEDVLNNLGLGGSEIPGDSISGGLKEDLDKYKAYASFYKLGANVDLDGDGCIDEELLDGQDNDGDGFISENARLAPTDPSNPFYGISSVKTIWNNTPMSLPSPVKIYNDSAYTIHTELSDPSGFVTVIGFTQELYPNGKQYWTTRDMDLKLKVAQDKGCTTYGLQYRKDNIGGCWPYYSEPLFKEYCKEP